MSVGDARTIEELLACAGEPTTREEWQADVDRIIDRLCEKHGITEPEIEGLIREHRYQHSGEDPEDEWIWLAAAARAAGWPMARSRGVAS